MLYPNAPPPASSQIDNKFQCQQLRQMDYIDPVFKEDNQIFDSLSKNVKQNQKIFYRCAIICFILEITLLIWVIALQISIKSINYPGNTNDNSSPQLKSENIFSLTQSNSQSITQLTKDIENVYKTLNLLQGLIPNMPEQVQTFDKRINTLQDNQNLFSENTSQKLTELGNSLLSNSQSITQLTKDIENVYKTLNILQGLIPNMPEQVQTFDKRINTLQDNQSQFSENTSQKLTELRNRLLEVSIDGIQSSTLYTALRGDYLNVASQMKGAIILRDGDVVFYNGSNPLSDNYVPYTGNTGFIQSHSPITVRFAQKYLINNILFQLYDLDNRVYNIQVQVSEDYLKWNTIYTSATAKSWMDINFDEQKVKYIRILNTAGNNQDLNIIHIRAFYSVKW